MITWQPTRTRRTRRLRQIALTLAPAILIITLLCAGVANLAQILFTAFFGA